LLEEKQQQRARMRMRARDRPNSNFRFVVVFSKKKSKKTKARAVTARTKMQPLPYQQKKTLVEASKIAVEAEKVILLTPRYGKTQNGSSWWF
jgi:hypothetical protein